MLFEIVETQTSTFSDQARINSKNKSVEEKLAVPYTFTRLVLGYIGALPLTWSKPHTPSLHPIQSTLVLAVCFFIASFLSASTCLYANIVRFYSEDLDAQEKLLIVEVAIIVSCIFVIPLLWIDIPIFNKFISLWMQIMGLYKEIVGRKCLRRGVFKEKAFAVMFVSVTTIVIFLGKACTAVPLTVPYSSFPGLLVCLNVPCFSCWLWIGYVDCVRCIAKDINAELQKDLTHRTFLVSRIKLYREFWICGRSLIDSMAQLKSAVYIFVLFVGITIMVLYKVIVFILLGNYFSGILHFILSSFFVTSVFHMARLSQTAIEETNYCYNLILAEEDFHFWQDNAIKETFFMYFVKRARSPVATFGEFVTVDKTLVTTVFGAITTHIIMLFQVAPVIKHSKMSQMSSTQDIN